MRQINRSQSGFSLIELAIVLVVLGAVLAPLFGFILTQQENDRQREEEAVNERILGALAIYLRQVGAYPCPADPTLAPGAAAFGQANCTAGGVINTAGVSIGAVPIADLNLPFRLSANKDNWKYRYAVTTNLTTPGTFGTGVGAITVINAAAPVPPITTTAQFIIVNPGKDGKGMRGLNGIASTLACATAIDAENCDGDATFVEADFSPLSDPSDANYYDDTIAFTLTREESTFWVATPNMGAGGLNVVNRNEANVGIGTFDDPATPAIEGPTEKLHVRGGNLRVQSDGTTGGGVEADNEVRSPSFFYQ
ncbi:MAG: type II secretion system protein [Bdellovibrionales bacterium]